MGELSWGLAHGSALRPFLHSARELEKARQQLQDEVRQVSSQLLEERKKRETQEALARRLQKRVLLLTKVPAGRGGGEDSLSRSAALPPACLVPLSSALQGPCLTRSCLVKSSAQPWSLCSCF